MNLIPARNQELSEEIIIPTADVKLLKTTAYTLVSAQGPNTIVEFLGGLAVLDFKTAAYTGLVVGEDLQVTYGSRTGVVVCAPIMTTGFLDASSDKSRIIRPIATDYTPAVNTALVLSLFTNDVATGDSPLRLYVKYRVYETYLGSN